MPAESTKIKALNALDGMATIVKNEMLVRCVYVTPDVVNEKLAKAGAICGGHKACAIGSLWLGAGVKMIFDYGEADLPGVRQSVRDEFLAHRPGLKLAYDALNEAADRFGEKNNIQIGDPQYRRFDASIEALFEDGRPQVGRKELLQVINNAKRKVRAA